VCAPITLGLVGVTSRNFSTRRAVRQGCSSGHYFWGKARPLKFGGQKRLKFGAISDNFRVWSWISLEQIHISKIGKVVDQLQPLPLWGKYGELWSTNKKVIGLHTDPPKWNFGVISDNFPLWFTRWHCCERHLNHPKLSLQSDLRRRAALRWALPHISICTWIRPLEAFWLKLHDKFTQNSISLRFWISPSVGYAGLKCNFRCLAI